jgi:hypothetical protein
VTIIVMVTMRLKLMVTIDFRQKRPKTPEIPECRKGLQGAFAFHVFWL